MDSYSHFRWRTVVCSSSYNRYPENGTSNRPADFMADGGASKSAGVGAARRRLLAWKDWRSLTPLVTRECV